MKEEHVTLGKNVIPIYYRLEIEPDLEKFIYKCNEEIELHIEKESKEIVLNAAEVDILDAEIKSKEKVQKAKVILEKKNERAIFRLNEGIRGKVKLLLRFTGKNNDKLYGFCRSRYIDGKKERYMLTSQFEATDARKAFPCFDEPEFKARFDISMIIPRNLDAVSNMPIRKTERIGKKKRVIFETTPKMSTYLLYLGVGDFEFTVGRHNNTKIRIITTPGKKRFTRLPLDYAKMFLNFYEKYFNMKFPLPKLDLLAIPDFAVGGMENWGAITFRETALLGEKNSAVSTKQRIAEVIAHEIAHQWFGDLVTMKWWDDLWLNESFATFMETKAVNELFPEWKIREQYLISDVAYAFTMDQLEATHPIKARVNTPDEISSAFDSAITYSKGGAVLHIIEDYSGETLFKEGLRNYVRKYAYSNATEDDLWRSIEEKAKKNNKRSRILDVARSWINTTGYPALYTNFHDGRLAIEQKRFMISNRKKNEKWIIPINYICDGSRSPKTLLMDKNSLAVNLGNVGWIKLNHGQGGLYRTFYDSGMQERLGLLINNGDLSGADSWGIENDLFALARSGRIMVDSYLDFIEKYALDHIYPMNVSIMDHLIWLRTLFYKKKAEARINGMVSSYSSKILDRLGWDRKKGESAIDTMLRSSAISALGLVGDSEVVERSKKMFWDLVEKKKNIDQNLRGAIYGVVAANGDERIFDAIAERYEKELVVDEKMRLLGALGRFTDEKLVRKALDFNMSKSVRFQDAFRIPAILSFSHPGNEIVWSWTKKNWKKLMKTYSSGTLILDRFIGLGISGDKGVRRDFASFFSKKENMREDIKRTVKQRLEFIDANMAMLEKNS